MVHIVEINLRIPSLRIKQEVKEAQETVANNEVRFNKQVELESIPKTGDVLTMTVTPGGTFQCEVTGSEWSDDKNKFVVACRYSKRSITSAEYQALLDSSDWHRRALI